MTAVQALRFFLVEAVQTLLRSWRSTTLAVATIALGLFVGGCFYLGSWNALETVERWRQERRITIYLAGAVAPEDQRALVAEVRNVVGVGSVTAVSPREAEDRFRNTFPALAEAVAASNEPIFPPLLEVEVEPTPGAQREISDLIQTLVVDPRVEMVDDDQAWLRQADRLAQLVRGAALGLWLGLLAVAVLTTASVVKLVAYTYLDEIAVLRLVGATEFLIRGPFYTAGLLQGLLGGVLAVVGLFGTLILVQQWAGPAAWALLVASDFLPLLQQGGLVLLGGGAGLLGAILSLRRERLEPQETTDG